MSILRNLLGAFVPHFEARQSATPSPLAAVNAELVHDVSGDETAVIYVVGGGAAFTGTLNIQGSADGANYFDLLAYPYAPACVGGTLPAPAQPLTQEAFSAVAGLLRAYCVPVGGLRRLRIRATALTAGSVNVFVNTDERASISPYIREQKAATLMVSATGAASAAVTLTMPAVAGLRHYIDRISVVRSATAALTAAATPVLVTTTNLPGAPALTFGSDAAGIGIDREQVFEFGGAGLAASAINTATTVVCPVYTGVIWRINAAYRLGL